MLPEFRERTTLGRVYIVRLTCAENNAWIMYLITNPEAAKICTELDYAGYLYSYAVNSREQRITKKKFFAILKKWHIAQKAFMELADEWVKANVKETMYDPKG
jgi:hypothetical protein